MDKYITPYNPALHDGLLAFAALQGMNVEPPPSSERFIGFGDTKDGHGAACILDICGTDYVAEPHVSWFPWTTPANKIVNFKWAMDYLAQSKEVLIIAEKKEKAFFDHFVKKGLFRKVGYLDNIPQVEEVHMYQYKKGKNE